MVWCEPGYHDQVAHATVMGDYLLDIADLLEPSGKTTIEPMTAASGRDAVVRPPRLNAPPILRRRFAVLAFDRLAADHAAVRLAADMMRAAAVRSA